MTDKKFLKILKDTKRELLRRFGEKRCSKIDIDCADCHINILLGYLDEEIDVIRWALKLK